MELKKIKLDSYFVNPRLLGDMSRGIVTTTTHQDYIFVGSQKLFPSEKLIVGEAVKLGVWQRNFYLWYQSDINAYESKKEALRAERDRLSRIKKQEQINLKFRLSKNFWGNYQIPFKFEIQVKEVLSGLSEGSNGCGTKRNTKFHINLKEDYKEGRLVRKKGDFLCSNSKSKFGADWSGSIGVSSWDFDCDGVKRIVSCKSCLKKIERFKINN